MNRQTSTELSTAISVKALTKKVSDAGGELIILNNISFDVTAGVSMAIAGASGSGKSTLLGLLAGLDVPTSGSVELLGQSIFNLDEDGRAHFRAQHVGFIFQSFHLLPHLTALENVMLPLELAGQPARQAALSVLEAVGLAHRINHYPATLSGGEQQRVSIARAFIVKPALLFADEPTGSLDVVTGAKIIDLMFDLHKTYGTTLILVTHDALLAQRCDKTIYIQAGELLTA